MHYQWLWCSFKLNPYPSKIGHLHNVATSSSLKSSISSSHFGWVIIKSVLELILLYLQVYSALLNLKWLLSDNFDESKIFVVGGSVFAFSGVRGVKWYSHVISIRSSPFYSSTTKSKHQWRMMQIPNSPSPQSKTSIQYANQSYWSRSAQLQYTQRIIKYNVMYRGVQLVRPYPHGHITTQQPTTSHSRWSRYQINNEQRIEIRRFILFYNTEVFNLCSK